MVSCFARAYHTGANACPVFSDTTARTLRFCLFGFFHIIPFLCTDRQEFLALMQTLS